MALIIEDGTSKPDAQTWASESDLRTYALARGVVIAAASNGVDPAAIALVKAVDYLTTRPRQFIGMPTLATQALPWPRINLDPDEVFIALRDGTLLSSTSIPRALIKAQMMLAIAANSGVDFMPIQDQPFITVDKTGPIETHYSDKFGSSIDPSFSAVDALLSVLFVGGGSFNTMVSRA